jgi:IS5 family transposase
MNWSTTMLLSFKKALVHMPSHFVWKTLVNPCHPRDNGSENQGQHWVMGGRQLGFPDYEQTTAKKRTKREKFLAEMEKVLPWQRLVEMIEPHYPKTGEKGGMPPYPLATMLRIQLMQQWYSLSNPAMEETLIEVPSMRRFAGIDLLSDRIPDETTILTFRHLLERYELGDQIFETVKAYLKDRGMEMRQGTIIDATLITAPSYTKNNAKERDPEMHQTKKSNQWYFGM